MTEEDAMRLSQELLAAKDEDARARVVVKWLPDFARCQVKTAARVKQLVASVDKLGAKMDAYHAAPPPPPPTFTSEDDEEKDPRLERLKLILAFAQRNWPAAALLAILIKVFDLGDLLAKLF